MLFPFQGPYYIDLSQGLIAWIGWAVMALILVTFSYLWRDQNQNWSKREWIGWGLLAITVGATTPFFGVHLSNQGILPLPERPALPNGPALMFLSALPWMIGAGLLGVIPATLLGGLSGLLLAFLDTHNPFTILVIAGLALFFSVAIRQRFRTRLYQVLRHPAFSALGLCLCYIPIYFYITLLTTPGALAGRMDYAFSHFLASWLAVSGSLVISGLVTEGIAQLVPYMWGRAEPLLPSPAESNLLYRVFFNIIPIATVFIILLIVGDWLVSENAARQMLEDRLTNTAQITSTGIPYFLETGQNLILQFAGDSRLVSASSDDLNNLLEADIRGVPFFTQLIVLNKDQNVVASYPGGASSPVLTSQEQKAWLALSYNGVNYQFFTEDPEQGGTTARVVFLASLKDSSGNVTRVLWGSTDLASNPYTSSIIAVLAGMNKVNGEGELIDGDGYVLYHPDTSQLMTRYSGEKPDNSSFFDETAANGTRQLVYYQPLAGNQWAIVLTVPATQMQQMAMNIAIPLLIIVLLISIVAAIILYFVLRSLTTSITTLSGESYRISQGQLNHALPPTGAVDEIGQLRDSFEQMRISLKARLDELNSLLRVSQGVASSLNIQDAIQPILDSALGESACLARIVLADDRSQSLHSGTSGRFGVGPSSILYAPLDDEILTLTQQHETIVLSNLERGQVLKRVLNIPAGVPHPTSLAAVALRHENHYYGALWLAYDSPHNFSDEELRFLSTLAGETAMATSNARLYEAAELGRQQLEVILASTPEPVLVTDRQNRILLTNPAAMQLPGITEKPIPGQPIQTIIHQNELLTLLSSPRDEQTSREITFPNGKVYFASVCSVMAERQLVGKVCILRDVTHYKELDALKSDFVATVSHDLRLPLTMMRGYATMLQMVGDLNEQQKGYVRKVVNGVENMSLLVNNLLDLGRIEAGVGLQLGTISATEVIDHVISSLQLQAAQKEIQFGIEIPENRKTMLEADPALLQQAVYNLVENAIKFTPVHGNIHIGLQDREDSILFIVQDSGIGIAPIDQPRLFEKFYRGGQHESNPQRGSGLGLAIVKSIAERHGGKVWLESTLGRGSTFYLEIPRTSAQSSIGK